LTHSLPVLFAPNIPSAYQHGFFITDNLVSWIKEGYVCGPFDQPPFPALRVNPIQAVVQHDKIRPVLNLSYPPDLSFNDALFQPALIKPIMTSARQFAHKLFESGKNSVFSKFDMKTAYKNIPQHSSIWPYQAMFWLDKFFIDISTVFGSGAAPSQFDVFSATVQFLAKFFSQANPFAILRQLDDLIILAPAYSDACHLFTSSYRDLCNLFRIRLADPCPKFEKAFENSTHGLVLGLLFDSTSMTWALPNYKFSRYINSVDSFLSDSFASLHDVQSLAGFLMILRYSLPFLKLSKSPFHIFFMSSPTTLTVVVLFHTRFAKIFISGEQPWLPQPQDFLSPCHHKDHLSQLSVSTRMQQQEFSPCTRDSLICIPLVEGPAWAAFPQTLFGLHAASPGPPPFFLPLKHRIQFFLDTNQPL